MQQHVYSLVDEIHSRALDVSVRYKRDEAELIDVLQQVDAHQVFLIRGHASLFSYVVQELGLSESTALSLISVARKAREVPALKEKLQSGEITLSGARRIVAVITPENQNEWIEKASTLTARGLEKEIVKVRPQEATRERASYVTPTRVKLELGLSEFEMLQLRRVQDLLSQSQRRSVSLEDTISSLTADFLHRHDPIEKAKRHTVRKGANTTDPVGKLCTKRVEKDAPSSERSNVSQAAVASAPALEQSAESQIHQQQKQPSESTGKAAPCSTVQQGHVLPTDELAATPTLQRVPTPAANPHAVNLRDHRRCTHLDRNGVRCNQTRFIDIHHIIAVSNGGTNDVENLITLCSPHHRLLHLKAGAN